MHRYLLLSILLLFGIRPVLGQAITFGIANKVTTSTDVTFDVVLSSDTPFKLGSGQLYFNFNTAAFGEWVVTNNRVSIIYPDGSILAQQYLNILALYNTFVSNDNTASRFSFSWQQAFSSAAMSTDNITSTAAVLFQVKIDFDTGGSGEPDELCFESGAAFDHQTFTACGPTAMPAAADCFNFPGVQLTNEIFNCDAILPVELLSFEVSAKNNTTSLIQWQTVNESYNDYFTIERSFDGRNFVAIDELSGAGHSQQLLHYEVLDTRPQRGVNYYRLKQTDYDGTYSYSEIRSVTFSQVQAGIDIEVFPNPTSDVLRVRFNEGLDQGQLQLFDGLGRLIIQQQLDPQTNQTQLSLQELTAGLYWISIEIDGQRHKQSVVVAKD
ncbi:MAG: T9SS type A sorting domain-containing protein [Bacteroidota bacterium]